MTDQGSGAPAVVLLHGAGESSYSWAHVRNEVSRFARIVTYDRPGLGSSDPGPGLDASASVDELRTLLTRAGVPGPYVLVGHSIGGIMARLYAIRYPEEVSGMVLVDSTHEFLKDDSEFRRSFAVMGTMLKVFRCLSVVGLPRFLGQVFGFFPMYPERPAYASQISREEYRDWTAACYRNLTGAGGLKELEASMPIVEEAARQMTDGSAGPQFGDLPMVVLSNPGFGEAWLSMHRELAGRSTNSIHLVSDRKGHNLQMTRPDLVVGGIRHVVEQISSRFRVAR
ncbi:MAG TPA: alpha/beta hydrolase [Symbiobacteriaceae bacterium]|nr:alpha/beta hydrolase [Symbiobacteriaceae bacterium]